MKNNLTEMVFILDASGSMHGLEADTIGGFNSMIDKQKAQPGEAYVSTVVFNTASKVVHDRLPLKRVSMLTERDYCVSGCTALYDAIGDAVKHIGNIHKYARREDVPEKTLFIITTDGLENASTRYDRNTVRMLIERQKEKHGWEFLFLGANIDAESEAEKIGIGREYAATYRSDKEGTRLNYEVLSEAMSSVRANCEIPEGWADSIRSRDD
ncbi:MAG: VWA domain-containing protein [Clostridia bacterium]|nr:VWA domain-containing protein [Clostridia bacterium]